MQRMIDEPMEILDIFGALEESKEEGREEGREEGKAEGRELERLETVRNMLADNVSDDRIIRYTGIAADALEKLKKETGK